MSTKSTPLVSVLIVTLRGGENLKKCLLCLKKNNYKHYEMVVVNNGGGIKINREVREIYPHAKLVNLKENAGFAKGNNTGYKYCKGDYILFLNDDTFVTPDFLHPLVDTGEKNSQIAVIQPKTIFTKGVLQSGGDYLTPTGFLYHYGYGKDPDNPIYNTPLYIYSANGNCMLVKRKVIEEIGLFDEDFFAYLEDTGFCQRAWLAGYRVVYIPKSTVYHRGAETTKTMDKSLWLYHPHKNRLYAHLKNLGLKNLIIVLPKLLILYEILFLYLLAKRQILSAYYIQKAIWWNIINLPSTLGKRNYIQNKIRKVSDDKFMKLVSYSPRLSYYLYLILGLKKYKDNDDLIKTKDFHTNQKQILNQSATVLIATFSPWIGGKRLPTNGSVEPMLNYFIPKVKQTVLIDQAYPESDFLNPRIEVYENNRLKKISATSKWIYILLFPLLKLTNKSGTHISFKLRDFFSVVDWCIRDRTCFDFFIGLECINTLAGIMMRKLGFVKTVIYYVSDYSPHRYQQKWFNNLYLGLDRFCAIHADYVWDVSAAMQPERIKAGLDVHRSAPVIHIPNALNPTQIKYNSLDKISCYTLVYMGTLSIENGPDLAITAMPEILKKYPKTVLHLIGGGEKDLSRLKNITSELKLEKKIIFHGFIPDGDKMSQLIRDCYVAVAPYRAFPGSPRYYGDAGKIRAYTAAGLPVITTDVPPLGKEAERAGAAIIVKDRAEDFASTIIKIFSDKNLYLKLRKGAISFARDNTWENSFNNAFQKMEKAIKSKKTNILNNLTNVLIASFSPWDKKKRLSTNGNIEPLLDFFVPKVGKTVLIDQPYPGSDIIKPRIEVYENKGKACILSSSFLYYSIYPFLRLSNKPGTRIFFKLRDLFSVIDWCIRDRSRYDFFIGLECINALTGIFLRKFGFIHKVIYYVSDYSPNRYPNRWFNALYLYLDRFCVLHADYTWDVSKAMQPARIAVGLDAHRSVPVIHVPNGLYPAQIKSAPHSEILPHTLVFMGTLGEENGPDIAIEAIPYVLKKFPRTTLHIIGGGDRDIEKLKNKVSQSKLDRNIIFHGFISDRKKVSKLIKVYYAALAPYRAFPGSPRYWGDATKMRAYLASGLPVITTEVPPLGKEAKEKGAAIIVKDNPQDLACAIIRLFSDRKLYLQLRKGAISFAKDNTWENTFTNAFKQMNLKI